jgi:hypothetical protein
VHGDSIAIGSEGQGEDSRVLSRDMGHRQFTRLARDANREGGPTSRKKLSAWRKFMEWCADLGLSVKNSVNR